MRISFFISILLLVLMPIAGHANSRFTTSREYLVHEVTSLLGNTYGTEFKLKGNQTKTQASKHANLTDLTVSISHNATAARSCTTAFLLKMNSPERWKLSFVASGTTAQQMGGLTGLAVESCSLTPFTGSNSNNSTQDDEASQ